MLIVDHASDLKAHVGQNLGTSKWFAVEQTAIDDFARLTGDDNWIHIDVERAAREMPGGRTIAHGLYILSLIPILQRDIYAVRRRRRGLNYGYDRIRFVSPVPTASRIRLSLGLVAVEAHALGVRIETEAQIDLDGTEKPALAARNILLITDD